MYNAPDVKIGIVAVSRDCFPESLSVNRRKAEKRHISLKKSSGRGLHKEI